MSLLPIDYLLDATGSDTFRKLQHKKTTLRCKGFIIHQEHAYQKYQNLIENRDQPEIEKNAENTFSHFHEKKDSSQVDDLISSPTSQKYLVFLRASN